MKQNRAANQENKTAVLKICQVVDDTTVSYCAGNV